MSCMSQIRLSSWLGILLRSVLISAVVSAAYVIIGLTHDLYQVSKSTLDIGD